MFNGSHEYHTTCPTLSPGLQVPDGTDCEPAHCVAVSILLLTFCIQLAPDIPPCTLLCCSTPLRGAKLSFTYM